MLSPPASGVKSQTLKIVFSLFKNPNSRKLRPSEKETVLDPVLQCLQPVAWGRRLSSRVALYSHWSLRNQPVSSKQEIRWGLKWEIRIPQQTTCRDKELFWLVFAEESSTGSAVAPQHRRQQDDPQTLVVLLAALPAAVLGWGQEDRRREDRERHR